MEGFFTRTPTGSLAPADNATAEWVGKLKIGQGVRAEIKRARDIRQHRRMFALFGFAFDNWNAPVLEYDGQPVAKNFDQFRRNLTILAGYYIASPTIDGHVDLEAQSLAFHNMTQDVFEPCYKAILTVVWDRILSAKGYETPAKVDALVHELLRFE